MKIGFGDKMSDNRSFTNSYVADKMNLELLLHLKKSKEKVR
jgi:hypothetical protein